MTTEGLNRRQALTGAAVAGLGVPLLAACSGSGSNTAKDPATGGKSSTPAASTPAATESTAPGALATTADIPVGGGTIFADQKVVVTQPTQGEFKGFSAVCTHQGCVVSDVTDTINCKCHNSVFALTDGSVVSGPATSPLPEAPITVDGDSISLA